MRPTLQVHTSPERAGRLSGTNTSLKIGCLMKIVPEAPSPPGVRAWEPPSSLSRADRSTAVLFGSGLSAYF